MKNKTLTALRKAGYQFSKKNWPTIPVSALIELDISRSDFNADTAQATIHMTMGPMWRLGMFLQTGPSSSRPLYFKGA